MNSKTETIEVVHGADTERRPIFSVLLKRSYRIGSDGKLSRCEGECDFVRTDQYYDGGDPEWSTVKYEAELVPFKPFTDVVVIGQAHASDGRATTAMDISVTVRTRTKTIRVIGDRQCHYRAKRPPVFTDPAPFETMQVRYERAYGGKDEVSAPQTPIHYARNDMGCGFALSNVREKIEGLALPNLEDPNELLTPETLLIEDPYRWNSLPLPQGFGWVQRGWYPRSSFIGSMPPYLHPTELMREEALSLVPRNQVALSRQYKLPSYHPLFNNGASVGLIFQSLVGDEPITLLGLTPSGRMSFALPAERPQMMLDLGLGENQLEPVLHTVCVRPDDHQVDLIWRASHVYPGIDWLPNMTRLHAEVA